MKLTKEDVWGKFNEETMKRESDGMVVARSGEKCPIFGDEVPYKSVTVVFGREQESEVVYWLDYVHGGGITERKELDNDKVALRSNYMCW